MKKKLQLKICRIVFLFIITFLYTLPSMIFADSTAGVPRAQSVLVIYTSKTTYSASLKDGYVDALEAISPAPCVTELEVATGDGTGVGFYDELVAQTGETDLSRWCQVWDVRFDDAKNGVPWTSQANEDVLTLSGANNDASLFDSFLSDGGGLFIQAEHEGFQVRNANVMSYINSIVTSPITQTWPGVDGVNVAVGNFQTTPENFSTDYNTLSGTLATNWAGGITISKRGSGSYLTSATFSLGTNPQTTHIAWLEGQLKGATGRLIAGYESNAFEALYSNATSDDFIENMYDLLTTVKECTIDNDIEKSVSVTEAVFGDTITFCITYTNNEDCAITFDIWDTLPSVTTYVGCDPSCTWDDPVVSWTVTNLAAGAAGKVCFWVEITGYPYLNEKNNFLAIFLLNENNNRRYCQASDFCVYKWNKNFLANI